MNRIIDALSLGWLGVRGRPGRAIMSALGIALGIATLVLVTGIPASGQANLDRQLTALGADVLVAQGAGFGDQPVSFPPAAAAMVRRIGPVEAASAIANLNVPVLRTNLSDPNETAGITAFAATPDLLTAVHGTVVSGSFLTATTERFPTVVLGSSAANWLGITSVDPAHAPQIWIGDAWFTVVGILGPMPLTPELEPAVFVGWDGARSVLGFDGHTTVVYLRAAEPQIGAVRDVLPATLDPALPGLVSVSRPSDVLAAKRATQNTFSALFLGLAGVALTVGGIGVANTMIVSVLERRREIGLRRALGATRADIRGQFLTEAALLSLLGGAAGAAAGLLGTTGYSLARHWPPAVPIWSMAAGCTGAVIIGAVAGLYPAVRAAGLSPTEALATA
jgi:putative ABC transport system permease protein